MTITAPTSTEASISSQLRHKVLEFIGAADMSHDDVAALLDVSTQTVGLLLSREKWDMRLALSVADQLGVKVAIT